jgi:AcrR family transcriptional regulator
MNKKEAILNAALDLFAERGFHGTSVADIADKSKVGAGTIYRYFRDKEALVNSLYRYWKEELMSVVLTDLPADLTARQIFHLLWSRMTLFAKNHRSALMFLEAHHHADYLDQASRELSSRTLEKFHDLFQSSQRHGQIRFAPPALLVAIVFGAFMGVEKAFINGLVERTSENETQAEEVCWEAIRMQGQ